MQDNLKDNIEENTEPVQKTEEKTDALQNSDEKTEEIQKTEEEKSEGNIQSDDKYNWYAVRIIAGHEHKVKSFLDAQIKDEGLGDKVKNVLIPLEKVFEVKGGKKKIKLKNFLPGYILIQADLDEKIRSFISQAPSILNMVGAKSVSGKRLEPIPLRESEIKRINAILNDESQGEKIDFRLTVGDPVKVTSGPFNNFSGNVLEINMEKMKVKVMVSIFGRKTPIELEFTQVEREK